MVNQRQSTIFEPKFSWDFLNLTMIVQMIYDHDTLVVIKSSDLLPMSMLGFNFYIKKKKKLTQTKWSNKHPFIF